jgi:formylglycine-generating enzyme required for sulfatase activity
MTDIFVSYARMDAERAKAIAKALNIHGWKVWWDLRSLRTGQSFGRAIEKALGQVRCVIVLWSRTSVESRWVEAEAYWAWEHDKLVSVLLDEGLRPPFPYHNLHAQDLSGWSGDTRAPAFGKLLDDLTETIGPPSSPPVQAVRFEEPVQSAEAPATVAPLPGIPEPEMISIQPGTFLMGSPDGEGSDNVRPQHEVRIEHAFAIGKYPVTFDEYDAFAKAANRDLPNDRGWGRGKRPVIYVSWDDAVAYVKWLSAQTGKRYRLPTEAEWEYACRAGTQTPWFFGNKESDLDQYAWHDGNSGSKTHPVGEKKPNPWGLHDVNGNVWDWVQDCWHESYQGAPTDGSAWEEKAGGDCGRRVVRGGSWYGSPVWTRSAGRFRFYTVYANDFLSFRLAQDL